MRASEPGWERIAPLCSANRRSAWMRLTFVEGEPLAGLYASEHTVEKIELCAGREGDDFYMVISKTNPQFVELLALFNAMRFAANT